MSAHRSVRCGWVGVLLTLLTIASAPRAQDEASVRRFGLGGAGTLVLKVPSGWMDKRTPGPGGLPTINFGTQSDPRFILTLEAVAMAASHATLDLHRETELVLDDVRAQAVETEIPLLEFPTRGGPGYYFAVTDIAARPGGFQYMDRGLVQIDGLVMKFTLLTHRGREALRERALALLGEAVFLANPAR